MPPGHCSQELPSIRIKKPREEHSCALCQVSATSSKGLNEHLQGKKHKLMEEKLRAGKLERQKAPNSNFLKGKAVAGSRKGTEEETDKKSSQPTLEDLKDCNTSSSMEDDELKVATKAENCPEVLNKSKKSFKFWCEPCRVGAFSETVFETHKKGKKHRIRLRLKGKVA